MGLTLESPGVAIVGCGLIGQKRAKSLAHGRLIACADPQIERAHKVAVSVGPNVIAVADPHAAITRDDVDIVVIAATNNALCDLTIAALRAGKHVLVEKPAARTTREIESMIEAADQAGKMVRVGFNHRYHPALLKAHKIFRSGSPGEMMFVRGRYGHGGRIGYDQEWR